MRVIAVANQKGGCGKTTTTVSLAWTLATRGHRTLAVDLDPQAHTTLALGVNPERIDLHVADTLMSSVFDPDAIRLPSILQTIRENLTLAPAGVELSALEHGLAGVAGREERLAEHLAGLEDSFDFVVIDCPPALGLLTFNALIAAPEAIVPVDCSPLALQGLGRLKETARLIEEMTGHVVRLRPLLTLFDPRTRLSRETRELVAAEFGAEAIETPIHYTVRLREKIGKGRIRSALSPASTAAKDYGALVDGLLSEKDAGARAAAGAEREPAPLLVPVPGRMVLSFEGKSADEVQLAGDFNGWIPDAGVEIVGDGEGRWRKVANVGPGTWQYKFLLRGEWVADPRNPHAVANNFCTSNSLIRID